MKPRHIGFIMDGNGRWAQKQGKKRTFGHEAGAAVAEKMVRLCGDLDIQYVTLYAFSAENWSRPGEEVSFLFEILLHYLTEKTKEMIESGVRIRFTGRRKRLPQRMLETMEIIEQRSKEQDRLHMVLAINYGGRHEIWDAFIKGYESMKQIGPSILESDNPENLRQFMYHPDIPDPDLVIRTSGEQRISNFLLWQMAYSELYFTPTLWPDFDQPQLMEALEAYATRHRRFGGIDDYGTSFEKRDCT